MVIKIEGNPKEIAALVLELQKQLSTKETIVNNTITNDVEQFGNFIAKAIRENLSRLEEVREDGNL